ncbi:unnamed protein product [Adineta ricciae]|uniref:non-specific serine/threonine protein kinase n=1 Tax=Adineta ricciae TaxID=249248 RepID=A0A815XZX9_ADIRI|nr:unnamed protein product [Adineta ricciae]
MSFSVETTPNHYTEYEIFSSTRFNQLGQQLLSLINPKHGTKPAETEVEPEPNTRNVIQQPSDLCRRHQQQPAYYFANQDTLSQITDSFLPHKSVLPFTAPPINNPKDGDEQITSSILDWQTNKQPKDSSQYLSSQIITIVQCRLKVTSAMSSSSNRPGRHAVRLFIDYQQHKQMDTFLDIVNEALLLDHDTIKTLWDIKGQQITDPLDLLRRGRLYFASRDEDMVLDECNVTDEDIASINRLETVRHQLRQQAYFVDKPSSVDRARSTSRRSTPFHVDDRRSSSIHGQQATDLDLQACPEVLLRHYSVGDVLGDGRFSCVYECRDKATGIQLALKIIDKTKCEGYGYLIENELAILRRVKHPNIIKLVEEFQTDLQYFLVFEYVSNGDLLTAVTTMNKYSEHDVALMLSQIAAALKHLHSLNIVHRDVKLDNILIANHPDQSVTLKLADFGLALCLTDEIPTVAPKHEESGLCGTPMYLAPEVIENRDYRIENDMWSLGIITFTLLSGLAPYDGDNDDEIIFNVINHTIDFNLLPKISMECREALTSMLERDPTKRISANDLLQHPWIKREMQKRLEPIHNESFTRRRKRGGTQQPLLTFSSVENPHSIQASKTGGFMGDINEL